MNSTMLEKMGLMRRAYNPAPFKAAIIDIIPPANCMINVRNAINRNSLFLYNNAFGTIFIVTKNKLTDSIWHIFTSLSIL